MSLLLFCLLGTATCFAQPSTITTYAGSGTPTSGAFGGDGGPATAARLNYPSGVALDRAGNLYVADTNNYRVRKVTPGGSITTVAGNGTRGAAGDGGPATAAQLNGPQGLAVDATGNLYIAEGTSIRKVIPNGVISTVAGNGTSGFGGDGGPATAASFHGAGAVAVDAAGTLYIADAYNNRIRKVTANGLISTVAGNEPPITGGQISGCGPSGAAGGRAIGDGGPAISASLILPYGVAVDAVGNVYVADQGHCRVRKVTTDGAITTVAGDASNGLTSIYRTTGQYTGDGGPATDAWVSPWAVSVDASGNLYIVEPTAGRVRRVTADGIITTVAGSGSNGFGGDGGPATAALLRGPLAVAVDPAGIMYIADASNHRVRRVDNSSPSIVLSRTGSFAQVASGGGWKTSITLMNTSAADAVSAQVRFYGSDGTPLTLPLYLPRADAHTTSASASVTIAPGAVLVVESEAATVETALGWADVQASGPLVGYAILRLSPPHAPDMEATVPLDTRGALSVTLPYDNTTGFTTGAALSFTTGVALVNLGSVSSNVAAVLKDEHGIEVSSSSITIPGLGYTSFFLSDQFHASLFRRGTIEFRNVLGGVTALGVRFNPTGSFTVLPIIR